MFGKLLFASAILMTGTAAQAYDYYVTAHNHMGQGVYFSCNGGTPREVHDDQMRTINLHGPDQLPVACLATHDGQVVWQSSYFLSHHQPNLSITMTPQQQHHDD